MTTDPFEDPRGRFPVLVDEEGRHAPWPSFAEAPAGRRTVFGEGTGQARVEYVETHWTGPRPAGPAAGRG
ncbi:MULTISPECIES: MbtH family protein [unclassified Streptomyces]|uniref:MbtH family protein n=1 Tax=unclassified Streptomyces TaxID=2593676 RepID=UPI0006B02631|nr:MULTISPECIES: MbtH family NRPS accessory protein [unclassified Streptomyces]KOX29823.1 protein mbtH [Streptomyces sp. NRRL F-6491]KOX43331.1 protein mbtH [Streptomyces sp. NRRL F-6492]